MAQERLSLEGWDCVAVIMDAPHAGLTNKERGGRSLL